MDKPWKPAARHPIVVVGVDGSSGSIQALRWALDYARRLPSTLKVVTAWHTPAHPTAPAQWTPERAAEEIQQRSLECLGALPGDVHLECLVVQGWPAEVLAEESLGSDLLVLGATGHSPAHRNGLGSTSLHCASHARCSVVIVRSA